MSQLKKMLARCEQVRKEALKKAQKRLYDAARSSGADAKQARVLANRARLDEHGKLVFSAKPKRRRRAAAPKTKTKTAKKKTAKKKTAKKKTAKKKTRTRRK